MSETWVNSHGFAGENQCDKPSTTTDINRKPEI